MINPDIRDHAYQFFIEEAPELLVVIESALLNLRQNRTAGQVHEIMRAAHSIKGGAASVELPAIKTIAHRLEDIFKALYNDAVVVDETMESLLLESFDCLKDALMTQIETGHLDHDAALEQALPLITAIEEQLGDYLAAGEQFLPSSADLGVDIVSSLFEVDIVQGLGQLQTALDSGDRQLIQDTLQAQTEVFAGLAEILNLSGFKAITDLVQQGLTQPDCDPVNLANLALTDWRGSCEQVLQHGDRQRGGEPSAALIALVSGGDIHQASIENGSDSAFAGFEQIPDLGDMFGDFGTVGNGEEFAGMEFPAMDEPAEMIAEAEDNVFAGMEFPDLGTPAQPLADNVFAGMKFPDLSESAEDNVFAGMEFPDLETPDQPSEENVFAGMEFPDLEPVTAAVDATQTESDFAPEVVNLDDPPYHFFIEEAPELLQAIENGLLTIRQDRSAAKVHEIMRAAHSLKGGAASVGLNGIKAIAHRLEDIFKALYSDDLVIDETLE
ncbi:MAG: Signal transduction histidine kinase CheA, partial [Cyanobacteriota bacterium]